MWVTDLDKAFDVRRIVIDELIAEFKNIHAITSEGKPSSTDIQSFLAAFGLCWRMKDIVQSGMVTCLPDRVPARGATTMTRMHRLAKPYHGSGRACPCHVSPTYSPTSRIRQQSRESE